MSLKSLTLLLCPLLLLSACQFDVAELGYPPGTADVTLYWSAPMQRVDGAPLGQSEIGGYEIRYRRPWDRYYRYVIIRNAAVNQHTFIRLADAEAFQFEVAAIDARGMFSQFVQATTQ